MDSIVRLTSETGLLLSGQMRLRDKATRRANLCRFGAIAVCLLSVACSRDHVARGDSYASAGRAPEAILEYRTSVQQNPRNGPVRQKLATLLLANGDVAGAFGEFVRAADLMPEDREAQV